MSVVPLVLEGSPRSPRNVVETEQEFHAAGGINGFSVLIRNLDREQLLAQDKTNVSYDLRVGEEYRDHRDTGKKPLRESEDIVLRPGAAVIVETEEYFHLPRTLFGHIVPRVTLLQEGLSNTSSKVDPGYFGHLLITVFNLGKQEIKIRRKEKFCCLYLLHVSGEVRPYDKPPKRIEGLATKRPWDHIRDRLEANNGLISAILILATLILTLAQLISLFHGRP